MEGDLDCERCGTSFHIRNGIPRFVPVENYASNFGFQWNRFRRTQLDSHSGEPISRERLHASTGWDWSAMKGKRILDVGCGSGRFAEVALQAGARVVGVDYSTAVDAAFDNLRAYSGFEAVQASVYELPFWPHSFDYVYCLGVLQHTPDPAKAFSALPEQVVVGGGVAVDIYPRLWRNVLWSKYWLRPLTKRMPASVLMRLIERAVPYLLPLSRAVSAVPRVGKRLKYALPVANYDGVYDLSEEQINEWAILDTFDMLSPEHDHPQSSETLLHWCRAAGLSDIEVFRRGHLIARGVLRQ
jgi:SAM-dependent methyltransferase